jgi:hypothetical protein
MGSSFSGLSGWGGAGSGTGDVNQPAPAPAGGPTPWSTLLTPFPEEEACDWIEIFTV